MVYCIQAYLIFADAATRDSRLASATTVVQNKPRFATTTINAVDGALGKPSEKAIAFEARYNLKGDQQSIETQILGLAGLQAGSWVQVHDCPHDQANPTLCVVERKTVI